MAAHPYWRLLIYGGGGDAPSVAEWAFFGTGGTSIPATGGTPLASSTYSSSYLAAYAFDGNSSTFWAANNVASNSAPEWLQYHFTSAVDIQSFSITARPDGFYYQAPSNFALQASDDGSTWTTLGNYSGMFG